MGAIPRRSVFPAARFLTAFLASIALLIAAAPSASAGAYTVRPCNGKPATELVTGASGPAGAFRVIQACNQSVSPGITLESDTTVVTNRPDGAVWSFTTPPGLSLLEVSVNLDFTGAWNITPYTWQTLGDRDLLEQAGLGGTRNPSDGVVTFTAGPTPGPGHFRTGTNLFLMRMICTLSKCGTNNQKTGFVSNDIRIVFDDESFPSIGEIGGTLLGSVARQGTHTVTLDGHDLGSGVASSEVLVDGVVVSTVRESNGGRCNTPFEFKVPCPGDVDVVHEIDTATLADGGHLVAIRVCDASGNCTIGAAGAARVGNAPTNSDAPTLTGIAKVGSTLDSQTGTWQGQPFQLTQQWLRCPAAVTKAAEANKCAPIAGATAERYVPVKADVGQRAMVRVTGTLTAAGHASSSATSAPSDVVADLPAVPSPPPPGGGGGGGGGSPPVTGPQAKGPPGAQGSPPQTQLKKRPRKKTALAMTRFAFVSDQPGSRFECKLDKKPFRACGSTFKKRLRPGAHVFRVRAVNGAGQVDATPAVFRWKIKGNS